MVLENTPLDQLKNFLNKLFQFESQDLDFGIYKILHYKRAEIGRFINDLLVDKVKEQLQTLTQSQLNSVREEMQELEKDDIIKGWLGADEAEKKILEKYGKDKIKKYNDLQKQIISAQVSADTENQIYNHLTLFFSRYYDKGDFISKRRFGKNEKYVVPYNGEETHFYWANHDQYYVKSSETFQKYAFKIPSLAGTLVVNFKLMQVQSEQGNVKAEENKYFILSEKEPELTTTELNIFFEYRALNDEEKKVVTGNNKQDALNEQAAKRLQEKLKNQTIIAGLWNKINEETVVLNKLHHYSRKNKYDFFIHKNLKGFLQRELDFYIKSELVSVDDLYVSETESHFERILLNLKTIKVFKQIADTLIEFLAQIEDFQKKLWEKKKFVLSTEWVITIDRLINYVGENLAKPILEEVLQNKDQIAEWINLFGVENIPKANLTIDNLKADLHTWRKLPIDTVHFKDDKGINAFKENLLNSLSDNINLEKILDGLVINTDNYQGLQLIKEKFYELVNVIYIDPPYNSGSDEFLYKDSFRNSSWLSMLSDRILHAKDILANDGLFFSSIDDKDSRNKVSHRLSNLLEAHFGKENYIENVIWVKNTTHNDAKTFSHNHEYIQSYTKNKETAVKEPEMFRRAKPGYSEVKELIHKLNSDYPSLEKIREELRNLYREQEEEYKLEIEALGLNWNEELKRNNPWKGIKQYKFADYRTTDGEYVKPEDAKSKKAIIQVYREGDPSWPNANSLKDYHRDPDHEEYRYYKPIHPITGKECPPPAIGWRWPFKSSSATSFSSLLSANKIQFGEDESKIPQLKRFLDDVSTDVAKSVISDFTDGEKELTNLIGERGTFPNPKPTTIIQKLISLSSKSSGYILDFFAGSGTTAHAVLRINEIGDKKVSFILNELGENMYETILPRIKKVAYTFDWKNGNPKDGSMNGLGVFFKYQRLEQYEESLENIAFKASDETKQKAFEFDQYIPKYFLEFETRGSQTLVNTEAMQNLWEYKLKVWDGFTYDTEQAVDLVETFNYLIGLHMQKCITKEINDHKYQFIAGNNNDGKQVLVVWRSTIGWQLKDYEIDSEVLEEQLKSFVYDLLYINGQAIIEGYQPIEEIFKNKMLP